MKNSSSVILIALLCMPIPLNTSAADP